MLYQKIYFKKRLTKTCILLYSNTLMFVTSCTFYHVRGLKRSVCVCVCVCVGGGGGGGGVRDGLRRFREVVKIFY